MPGIGYAAMVTHRPRWELDWTPRDTLRFVFGEPPVLPGRVWRTTLVRAD